MRRISSEDMNAKGIAVIGQVRIDARLYDEPEPGQRGTPRKYGPQLTPKRVAHLKKTEAMVILYGKKKTIRFRTRTINARFLKDQLIVAVWCELETEKGDCYLDCCYQATRR